MTEQHADLEALSAYVDGEAPEWADHVEGCAECRATAAELRAVANALGKRVEIPDQAVREVAIAAAVASLSSGDGSDGPDTPPLVEPGTAPRPRLAPERPLHGRRRASRPWALPAAAAAVIIAVLGFSGLVLSSYRSSDDTTTLAGPGLEADNAERGVAANAPSVPPTDLGDIPDAATLRARTQTGGLAASSGTASSAASSGAASDAAGTPRVAPGALAQPPSVSGSAAGSGGTGGIDPASPPTSTLNQRAAAPHVVGTRPCEEQARTRDPRLGEVVYFATARQGQEEAYVLGFATGPAPAPVTLLLLARDGCAELLRSTGP